MRLPIHDQ